MTSPDRHQLPSDRRTGSRFLGEALAYLSGEGRRKTPDALLADLRERFKSAGQGKLADLVYEMARACFSADRDFADHVYQKTDPRRPEIISGELQTMNECLKGVAQPPDLSGVARRTPKTEQALDDAGRCLVVLEQLEGPSDRHQLLTAMRFIHAGQPEAAEPLLRAMRDEPGHSPAMRWYATTNLAFSLHRQGRWAEAVPLAETALAERPDDPSGHFNLISAAAALGDGPRVESALQQLAALHRASPSPLIRGWLELELDDIVDQAGLDKGRVAQLVDLGNPPGKEA